MVEQVWDPDFPQVRCSLMMGNSFIFGDNCTQDGTPPQDKESTVSRLAAQRAARKIAATSESQPAAQGSKPAAKGSEPVAEGSGWLGGGPKSAGEINASDEG